MKRGIALFLTIAMAVSLNLPAAAAPPAPSVPQQQEQEQRAEQTPAEQVQGAGEAAPDPAEEEPVPPEAAAPPAEPDLAGASPVPSETSPEEPALLSAPASGELLLVDFSSMDGMNILGPSGSCIGSISQEAKVEEDQDFGKALVLNGSAYAQVDAQLNFRTPSSVSFWLQPAPEAFSPEAFTQPIYLLHQTNSDASRGRALVILQNSPPGSISSLLGTSGEVKLPAEARIQAGAWNHLAFTTDGAGSLRFYLNGSLVFEGKSKGLPLDMESSLMIGKHRSEETAAAPNARFTGRIASLVCAHREMTGNEIAGLYAEHAAGQPAAEVEALLGQWSSLKAQYPGQFSALAGQIDAYISGMKPLEEMDAGEVAAAHAYLSQNIPRFEALCKLQEGANSAQAFADEAAELAAGLADPPEQALAELRAAIQAAKEALGGSAETAELGALLQRIEAAREALDAALASLAVARVAVAAQESIGTFRRELTGANHRYAMSGANGTLVGMNGHGTWDYLHERITPQFAEELKEVQFGTLRFPGGTAANLYEWKRTIGPMEDRTFAIHGNTKLPIPSELGIDEAAAMAELAGGRLVYVYNFANGSIQDALDLIEYFNAPNDGSNPGGGTDWAAVRAANGHPEPYHVTQFEIGNEYYLGPQQFWTVGYNGVNSNYEQNYAYGGEIAFQNDNFRAFTGNKLDAYKLVRENDWSAQASVSTGEADLVRLFRYRPVKEGSARVFVGDKEWQIVPSLNGQGQKDVCVVDYSAGTVSFGDGVNGNIPAKGSVLYAQYVTVQPGFKDYGKAMKEFGRELGLEIEVYSCLHTESFYRLMDQLGDEWRASWDGAAIHPYGGANGASSKKNYHDRALGAASNQVNTVRNAVKTLQKYLPDGKMCATEYGIGGAGAQFANWLNSTGHGLYTAKSIMGFAEIPQVSYALRHSMTDTPVSRASAGAGQMGVISYFTDGNAADAKLLGLVKTPGALVMEMFNTFYGGTIVRTDPTSVPSLGTTGTKALDIQATRDENYLYIAVVNGHTDLAIPVQIKLDTPSALPTAETLTMNSPSFDAQNTLEQPDNVKLVHGDITGMADRTSFVYQFPAHSFTILRIGIFGPPQEPAAVGEVRVSGSRRIEAGMHITLSASVAPLNAQTKTVTWRILEGENAAAIGPESGVLRALSAGTARVVATCGGVESEPFEVTILPPPDPE